MFHKYKMDEFAKKSRYSPALFSVSWVAPMDSQNVSAPMLFLGDKTAAVMQNASGNRQGQLGLIFFLLQ